MLASSVIPFLTVYYFNRARRILLLSKNFRCTERYFAAKKCTFYCSLFYKEVRMRFTMNKLYNSALCAVLFPPSASAHWADSRRHSDVIGVPKNAELSLTTVPPVTPHSVPARDQGKLTTVVLA